MIAKYPSGAIGHLLYNNATFPVTLPNEGIFAGGAGWGNDGQYVSAGGWISDPGSICVLGTRGSLRIFHYANARFLNTGDGPRQVDVAGLPSPNHFAAQLASCVDAIEAGSKPDVDAQDGLAALSIILEAGGFGNGPALDQL
ncbi:hypothetical protein [Mesorhizobium sp. M0633]|uniref:hypothetical protein n=1 Tax=Mesorhizobium sp. M0633 TaxID=2956977 RepID=UPI00333B53DE